MKKIACIFGLLFLAGCAPVSSESKVVVEKTQEELILEFKIEGFDAFIRAEVRELMNYMSNQAGQVIFLKQTDLVFNSNKDIALATFDVMLQHRQIAELFIFSAYNNNGKWSIVHILTTPIPGVMGPNESKDDQKL